MRILSSLALRLLAPFAAAALIPLQAHAASSAGCEGGGFTIEGLNVTVPVGRSSVDAGNLVAPFVVRGRYVEFTVDPASFAVRDYTLTGAANALDITGGVRTIVFASKQPDHNGLVLAGSMSVDISDTDIVLSRGGGALSMKLQAKDCANGGIFQMEPQRGDAQPTLITHLLADGVAYFDNQNFRDREGDIVPYKDTTVQVTNRINFGNAVSNRFVGRDSPQVATRVNQDCVNRFANNARVAPAQGAVDTVRHCGGVSVWSVSSGGRMGQVMGEDATEVAPPATTCTHQCQAQNQVRGRSVNLGFPFPLRNVLQPRTPAPAP